MDVVRTRKVRGKQGGGGGGEKQCCIYLFTRACLSVRYVQ